MKKSKINANNLSSIQSFKINYENAYNNYSNGINYFIKNKEIITYIEKIISEYKETLKNFKQKLIQIKSNLANIFLTKEKNLPKFEIDIYPNINQYLNQLNNIFIYQINFFGKIIIDLENHKNISLNFNNENINILNILQENKNNFQKEEKKMEKIIDEYNNEHKKIIYLLEDAEESIKNFYINKRKTNVENKDEIAVFNNKINDTVDKEKLFIKLYKKVRNNNENFFKMYDDFLEKLKNNILNNYKYFNENIKFFLSVLINNYKNIYNNIKSINENDINNNNQKSIIENEKENNNIIQNEIINPNHKYQDFDLFMEKYFNKLERKLVKEIYKVQAIKNSIYEDKITLQSKQSLNILSNEFGMENLFEEDPIVLTEEDIYNIVKTFYGMFKFVDKSEYDLILEKNKINAKKIINKLLNYGCDKKGLNDKSDKPITDSELASITKDLKKKEFRMCFCQALNDFRGLGYFEMPENVYERVSNIIKMIVEFIFEDEEIDYNSIRLLIILSQTFFKYKNKEKYYLFNEIKGHKLFNEKSFWEKYLKINIENELKNLDNTNIKNKTSKKIEEMKKETIYLVLLPFADNMIELQMEKKILIEILEQLYKEYQLNESNQKAINDYIESKFKEKK